MQPAGIAGATTWLETRVVDEAFVVKLDDDVKLDVKLESVRERQPQGQRYQQ